VTPAPTGEPLQRLPRAALTYWRAQAIVTGLVLPIAAGSTVGLLWALPALLVAVLAGWFGPAVLWSRWRYEIREDEIDLRHGLLTVKRTLVPIRRVQHVETETGPVQNLFELSTVSVHTAAGATKIPALHRGEAEAVRRRVGELARTRDDV
jgi:membrane protein YdbS with pleckstrin-like domain